MIKQQLLKSEWISVGKVRSLGNNRVEVTFHLSPTQGNKHTTFRKLRVTMDVYDLCLLRSKSKTIMQDNINSLQTELNAL